MLSGMTNDATVRRTGRAITVVAAAAGAPLLWTVDGPAGRPRPVQRCRITGLPGHRNYR
jgi:hypothetical protein